MKATQDLIVVFGAVSLTTFVSWLCFLWAHTDPRGWDQQAIAITFQKPHTVQNLPGDVSVSVCLNGVEAERIIFIFNFICQRTVYIHQ